MNVTDTALTPIQTIDNDGIHRWTVNDRPHRDDGPAIVYPDGTQVFCQHGLLHNDTGPALILPNGNTYHYMHGQPVDTETAAAAKAPWSAAQKWRRPSPARLIAKPVKWGILRQHFWEKLIQHLQLC